MSLYTKMLAVMSETEGLSKDMSVGYGNNSYRAVSESAVLNVIKPLLKKHGLVIFPIKIEAENWKDEFTTKNGDSTRLITQVKATYKIVDTETGESETLETVGHGVDTQDKASGKAMTYAYKALLQKTFCMFSGEDTDNEHSDAITERQTKTVETITKNEITTLTTLAEVKGSELADILKYYRVAKLEDMDTVSYGKAIKALMQKKDI